MEISGKIIEVLPLQSGIGKSGTEWKKQSYVIETQEQYPKKMCFGLWGAKIDELGIKEGHDLDVYFNLECRKWNNTYINDVSVYKVVQRNVLQYKEQNSFAKEEKAVKDDLPF